VQGDGLVVCGHEKSADTVNVVASCSREADGQQVVSRQQATS